ncbi:MAG: hypothetical protein ACOYL6_10720 [Bacteriovoracaceae bacterium]
MKTKFLIVFISAWLFMTLTVDMLVLPQAFKVIGDIWLAGSLGIELFRHFNPLEILFSVILLVLLSWQEKKLNWKFFFPLILFFIALLYQFYLTPQIATATRVILSLQGQSGQALAMAQLDHHFYHTSYIRLDGVKLLCLFIFLGIIMKPTNKMLKKERIGL